MLQMLLTPLNLTWCKQQPLLHLVSGQDVLSATLGTTNAEWQPLSKSAEDLHTLIGRCCNGSCLMLQNKKN